MQILYFLISHSNNVTYASRKTGRKKKTIPFFPYFFLLFTLFFFYSKQTTMAFVRMRVILPMAADTATTVFPFFTFFFFYLHPRIILSVPITQMMVRPWEKVFFGFFFIVIFSLRVSDTVFLLMRFRRMTGVGVFSFFFDTFFSIFSTARYNNNTNK